MFYYIFCQIFDKKKKKQSLFSSDSTYVSKKIILGAYPICH